jgi:hypothetical protein
MLPLININTKNQKERYTQKEDKDVLRIIPKAGNKKATE